jgi:hypothetical protein
MNLCSYMSNVSLLLDSRPARLLLTHEAAVPNRGEAGSNGVGLKSTSCTQHSQEPHENVISCFQNACQPKTG